jgi:hypothetical protein
MKSIKLERFVNRFVGAGNGKFVALGSTTGYFEGSSNGIDGHCAAAFVNVAVVEALPPLSTAFQHVVLALPPEIIAGGLVCD